MNTTRTLLAVVMVMAAVGLLAKPADAALVGELGILDVTGVNPATGSPWQPGDQYRFAFVTSTTKDATSTDMTDYDTFVQAAADASSLGLGGAKWKALGSTIGLNSRAHTGTTAAGGGAIFLVDGATKVADNYNDFWDGSLDHAMSMDETGTVITSNTNVWAGMFPSGAPEATRHLGSIIPEAGGQFKAHHGRATETGGYWARVYNAETSTPLRFYGLSDPLTVKDPTKPDIFSVNFYAYGALPTADRDTVTLEADQAAGADGWNTAGWENIVVPWNPSSPLAPETIKTPAGSSATFTFKDARNGGPYWWNVSRSTLLGDGNGDLMDGHVNSTWDPGDGSKIFDMEVSDIPFDVYDVIVYLGGNQAQFGDGKGKIVFNGGPEQDFTLVPGEFAAFTEIVDGTTPGNYMVFEGVTGPSFTVQTWGMGNNGFNHLGPTGFQIRSHVPEPSTFVLAALGLLGMGWLGRQRRRY